jgi:endonuclease G
MFCYRARYLHIAVLASSLGAAGCIGGPDDRGPRFNNDIVAATTTEGFETGTKPAYAAANATLDSGTWNFNDALIGNLTDDVRTGVQAARIRNRGHITMRFDLTTGAGTVTIHHASFGSDASGSWGLFASQNRGGSWTQVGASQSTTRGSFSTATFTVNLPGTVRFEIRKLDGGSNRINIDDISITNLSSGGGDSDGGSGSGGGGGSGALLSRHTMLGIPSEASITDVNNFLSVKSDYVLSYDSSRKVPNWVSWELNAAYLGGTGRQDDFRPDDTLPANVPQASLDDYRGSGYDRGHMCPSADRTLDVAANSETFYLTNMVPQAANNNQGPWAAMENDLRAIARTGKELFIISGGTFSASSNRIGSGVVVPDKTFKVVVVLDEANQDASSVTTSTRVIGVMMPNENDEISRTADWRSFRVPVDEIEVETGDDFLSDVDPAVQAVIEARVDSE